MTDYMPDDLSATGRDLRAYTDLAASRPRGPTVRAVAPVGGWASVSVVLASPTA